MKKKVKKERRRAPRVRVRVPVKLAAKGGAGSISARTLDISYSGVYCRVGRFIPLNSEVDVELELPGSDVLCKGIVVRNKKAAGKDEYCIALFFSDMSRPGKKRIVKFIDSKLRKEGIKIHPHRKKIDDFVKEKGYVSRTGGLEISSAKFRILEGEVVINSKGLSCETDRKVPLFKEIAVNVVLPPKMRGKGEAIQCSGVVVSCDKLRGRGRYSLMIYFTGLSGKDGPKIDSFIESGKKTKSSNRR